ncbi:MULTISPECIES: hypothetical protein [Okeania]|uniref:Uncharacterized protein n=1 Tax=Okeania hirsuta TaxID=1458930 RepID=A0A3N6P5N1_9CYAN|nr:MULTISPECIES: hypothetical protein [Okeania]NET14737.1 hypothetical protein [Okeania sp. SIO1H6]NES75627.1 hypothetical protein [Okeania sp. SIO1H4]NES88658.1 hypothetical protein [Okeania sp. SIO2B9]NET19028.1 hypothetical protein [Okeania sp. SIO1H5]NET75355.1 hypothetical protein [Okeania sp. SIO1F9]
MKEEANDSYQKNEAAFSRENENTSTTIASTAMVTASLIGAGIGVIAASTPILGAAAISAGAASALKIIQRRGKERKATQ